MPNTLAPARPFCAPRSSRPSYPPVLLSLSLPFTLTPAAETWPEAHERRREWVLPAEAARRLAWKPELAQAFAAACAKR